MIKIILADDHQVMRGGMRMVLESSAKFQVIFEASTGQEVLDELSKGVVADLIISDIGMPVLNGIEMLQTLRASGSMLPVLIISMLESNDYLFKAMALGANAFLSKSVTSEELFFALDRITCGNRYISSDLSLRIIDKLIGSEKNNLKTGEQIEFSARETELISLIGEGLTNLEIADRLFLSKRTVEGQRQALMDKTGARNTASLMRYIYSNQIIK